MGASTVIGTGWTTAIAAGVALSLSQVASAAHWTVEVVPGSRVPMLVTQLEPIALVPIPLENQNRSRLMWAVERAAQESNEPARVRGTLLSRLRSGHACFKPDLTDEELIALVAQTKLLPPTQRAAPSNRFFADLRVWLGNGGQGASGTSRGATLTYSFPDDGVTWGLSCTGLGTGPNDLNAQLVSTFGTLDRGREFIRSGLAGWRRYGSLNYQEVADNNSAADTSILRDPARGDIRIGSVVLGVNGTLAYNAFPSGTGLSNCGGGDMTLNSSYFTGSAFRSASNGFRYLRNVVAHEHGHGLGFIHTVPCNRVKLMEPLINTNFDLLSWDDARGAMRSYGDRFAGNNNAAAARDFGNLTTPVVRSVIERDLSTNGQTIAINDGFGTFFVSADDWFVFTISSPQSVTITVQPTGVGCPSGTACPGASTDNACCQGQQTSGCSGTVGIVNALQAGNLGVDLRTTAQTNIATPALATASAGGLGSTETITQPTLPAGTYYVRVFDSLIGVSTANQTVQAYDLTVRVGTSLAPPRAIAGLNSKRVAANAQAYFIGNQNSYANETGATIPGGNYNWDLDGDGTFESSGTQPTFTYVSNGTYNATLRVTDSNSQIGTDTIQVIVFGAATTITSVVPSSVLQGATVPVTITGTNFKGVSAASQVVVSGVGVTVTGTPVVNVAGTQITGLSFVATGSAAAGPRDVTINNSDGAGATGTGAGVLTITTPATGACCAASGVCTTTTSAACSGAYQGNGTVCSPNPCPQPTGACCDVGGACTTTTSAACTGAYQGNGTVCSPNPCPQPTGACCDVSGACTTTTSAACTGAYQGNGTVCSPNPCPQPTGACCDVGGACTTTTSAACSGAYQGNGTVCSPNPCPQPTGACCDVGGACTTATSAACSGAYQGNGTVCSPNPCPQPTGACCVGALCLTTTSAACVPIGAAGAVFTSAGTACNVSGATAAPCCYANFDKVNGVEVADIFTYLAAWFVNNPACTVGGNGVQTPIVSDIFAFLAAWFAGCN